VQETSDFIGGPERTQTSDLRFRKQPLSFEPLSEVRAFPAEVNKPECNTALADPKMRARLADLGSTPLPGRPNSAS